MKRIKNIFESIWIFITIVLFFILLVIMYSINKKFRHEWDAIMNSGWENE